METIRNLYEDMLLDLDYQKIKRRGMKGDEKLTAQYTLVGEDYRNCENRLLFIGRSVNGWEADYCWDISQDFNNKSAHLKANEIIEYWNKSNLEWVKTPLPGKKKRRESYPYWYLAKSLTKVLTNATNDNWIHKLAWSNLYKIAPRDGGNPWGSLCAAQLQNARKILTYELETLKSTHVIFVTGADWFSDFEEVVSIAKDRLGFKSVVVSRPERRDARLSIFRKKKIAEAFGVEI